MENPSDTIEHVCDSPVCVHIFGLILDIFSICYTKDNVSVNNSYVRQSLYLSAAVNVGIHHYYF